MMEYYICVLDFEATCEKDNKAYLNEVIEFPSVLWRVAQNPNEKPVFVYVSEIQNYVKPVVNKILTPFCTELTGITQDQVDAGLPSWQLSKERKIGENNFLKIKTGITQDQVDAGLPFLAAFKAHYEWLCRNVPEGSPLIITTCGNWDLQTMLPKQLNTSNIRNRQIVPRIYSEWANMKFWYQETLKNARPNGMAGMLKQLGLPLVGRHHSGIDDCKNIWQIVRCLIEKGLNLQNVVKYRFHQEAWPKAMDV
eukprot:Phypoly_transcript_15593.p1 GENE.Phypoly_transcript_15593~~Phypoly_transcript_15593.p1  ORF type:complete len:252 (+),score=34.54 Phypoly_transcript_15593:86-841(+)